MKKIGIVRCMIVGVLMSAFAAGAAAQAAQEECLPPPEGGDCNYGDAQPLERRADGTYAVKGVIGVSASWDTAIDDVDLYSFFARKDDKLEIDIDGGIKSTCMFGSPRCVDTTLTLLGPDTDSYPVERQERSCLAGDRWGNSISNEDACLLNVIAPADGIYIVAVTGDPAIVKDGGEIDWGGKTSSNGEYLLIVSGASEAVTMQVINIEIKPGSREWAPINLKSRGSLPVALISSEGFDALEVDRDSLTFGATGDEDSLRKCGWGGEDVGGDSKLDLVCHFDNQKTGFGSEHTEGILKGTVDGKAFEGHGVLRVLPAKKEK